jgi:hypothetical protein
MLVGTAVNPVYLSEEAYTSSLAREFNMIETRRRDEVDGDPSRRKDFQF